jgi:hypothetical protein
LLCSNFPKAWTFNLLDESLYQSFSADPGAVFWGGAGAREKSAARRLQSKADTIVSITAKSVSWICDSPMQARGYGLFADYDESREPASACLGRSSAGNTDGTRNDAMG